MVGHDIVVIGASAGGVETLKALVSTLPADFPAAIFIVVHISPHATSVLPQILSRAGPIAAEHPKDHQIILPNRIYIAPPNYHLLLKPGYMRLTQGPRENSHRPSIDVLFRTAARAYEVRVIGVVLSGVLDDGSMGLFSIKNHSGIAIVQDPADAMYPGMPQNAIEAVQADYVKPVSEIPTLLTQLARKYSQTVQLPPVREEQVDVAELDNEGSQIMENGGQPTTYICPECGGVLMEYHEDHLIRFRCQVGHAYSTESLMAEQAEKLEDVLWIALRTLEENIRLTQRLAERAKANGYEDTHKRYMEKIRETEASAAILRQTLLKGKHYTALEADK